jgi:hypothetical protein
MAGWRNTRGGIASNYAWHGPFHRIEMPFCHLCPEIGLVPNQVFPIAFRRCAA